jgi:acylpyruvate hydrolase
MTLEAGDILITGTPEGLGPIREGDHLEATLTY